MLICMKTFNDVVLPVGAITPTESCQVVGEWLRVLFFCPYTATRLCYVFERLTSLSVVPSQLQPAMTA